MASGNGSQEAQSGGSVESSKAGIFINIPVQESSKEAKPASWLESTEQVLKLLGLIAGLFTWPLVILVTLLMFYSPLKEVVEKLPRKIDSSQEVSFGSFLSFKIDKQARAEGNAELAAIIKGLSQPAIQLLLGVGNASHQILSSAENDTETLKDSDFESYKELFKNELIEPTNYSDDMDLKGFFDKVEGLNIKEENRLDLTELPSSEREVISNYTVQLSASGRRAYDIIISVISESISGDIPTKQDSTDSKN
ncbi:hypothetical protein [Larkinella soli]|uniref:hypothetical protein n=1 Tax=Larkinella soli TaxID=1770527 RepID=UPI000FFBF669|nr:hypothetical protein [Larkinella soli]